LKPHTVFLSLGIHGKKALLPEEQVLEMTTMCGHGMVSSLLSKAVIKKVESAEMTPEEGATLLAQPCPCGIFNTDRCQELLKKCQKEA
jgi:heterodisulfide reductase subunit B